jgi:post-segregation antitoxin (ccd killing protein)
MHGVFQARGNGMLPMAASLHLRDIGARRKAALTAEAEARGQSVSEIVREWIDQGIEQSRAERARAEWIEAAKAGFADEASHLERPGPTLGRFRRPSTTRS